MIDCTCFDHTYFEHTCFVSKILYLIIILYFLVISCFSTEESLKNICRPVIFPFTVAAIAAIRFICFAGFTEVIQYISP